MKAKTSHLLFRPVNVTRNTNRSIKQFNGQKVKESTPLKGMKAT
jgi:hypothetical protein